MAHFQTQPIDINMGYQARPRSNRTSLTSDDSHMSDFVGSEYSSDNESIRFPTQAYDAQRTSAFSQATIMSSTNDKKSPNKQRRVGTIPSVQLHSGRLGQLWQRHKFRVVLACLLLCFIGFTSYDVYDTTQQQQAEDTGFESESMVKYDE